MSICFASPLLEGPISFCNATKSVNHVCKVKVRVCFVYQFQNDPSSALNVHIFPRANVMNHASDVTSRGNGKSCELRILPAQQCLCNNGGQKGVILQLFPFGQVGNVKLSEPCSASCVALLAAVCASGICKSPSAPPFSM